MTKIPETIDVHDLKKRCEADPNLCLIDVRELEEWNEAHIPGAVHIPRAEISDRISEVSQNYNDAIYLHCRSGGRSMMAAQTLIQMGYQNVYNVGGGILDWVGANYPVVK